MTKALKYVYCDSCVFIAYFNAEPGRVDILEQFFEEVQKDNTRLIVTSALSITEVAHVAVEKAKSKLLADIEAKLDAFWGDTSLIQFVDVHEVLARNARKLIRQAIELSYALKPPDALHLASAQFVGAEEFLTYDDKLFKFDSITGPKIVEPYVSQPKLPL